jgi:periplasmic protein TonB
MSYWARLAAFVAVSVAAHALLARGAAHLPEQAKASRPVMLEVQLRPPPTRAPDPEPEAKKPAEPEKPRQSEARPRLTTAPQTLNQRTGTARDVPPTERLSQSGDATTTPTFGISMESTSEKGAGPAMPVGNTLQVKPTKPAAAPAAVKPLAAPALAYEVTKMPLPKGQCRGEYSDEARSAGIEGTVVLDVVVGEDGAPRDIKVVQGLGHGLTEAAVAALRRCRFTPGERDGKPVPVRLRTFKIRFVLQGGD